jgi:hypothetical protein
VSPWRLGDVRLLRSVYYNSCEAERLPPPLLECKTERLPPLSVCGSIGMCNGWTLTGPTVQNVRFHSNVRVLAPSNPEYGLEDDRDVECGKLVEISLGITTDVLGKARKKWQRYEINVV